MGLYNNVPTFTYVSATGITVTYNDEVYTVQSFYTNKKYIYWDYENATVLQASNTMPTRSFKTHLVIINDNGIATTVPSTYERFEISFSGDNDEAIKSRIYALYEKNKELGDKYVAIEQDIEGIKQIVGSGESEDGSVLDRVSKIEQTSEDIKLSVSEIQKTYADDKEMERLREDLNSSIIELNSDLGTLNSEMSDYYKDNKITYEEKTSIEEGIALITNRKSEVLKYVNKVVLICEESNQNENLISLNSGISALENAHQNLIQNITVAISDFVITPSEKTVIIDGFAKYNLRINELKNTCDDIIFLGVGGVVSEKLAQITMNSNEIKLSVSSVETSMTSQLSLQKVELKSQIDDVNSQLDTFKDVVETTFKDGILDEAEKKLLEEKLSLLEKEKLDVDSQYEATYNDEYLVEPYKKILENEYNKYTSKHLELKAKINEVIKYEKVIDSDLLIINTLFNEYSSLLASLNVCLNNSLDVIATGKSNKEILAAKNELLKELEETNSKIDDVISDIGNFAGDGLVDKAEKKSIELSLQNLEKEKLDIDAQYNYWYSNSYLVNPLKLQYKNAYDNYVSNYNNSVNIITGIANKTELVSDTDRENMLNAHRSLADTLELFVEKANQVIEFVSQKQSEALKNNLQGEIDDINNKLGDLDFVIDGTFEDNIIDQAERKVLSQNLSDLELQKTDVDKQYEQLYKSSYLDGDLRTQFKTSYDNFVLMYNSLISDIQYILSKSDLINDTDRTNISNAQSNLNTAFGNFVLKSNEVIEYISKKQSNESIQNFDSELKDLNDKVDGILGDIDGALSDDVLDKAERLILENGLNDLEVQKNDVVSQYENIFNNVNLTDTTIKGSLTTSYGDFISCYNNLVNNIQYLLGKSGNITDGDRVNYQAAYDQYKESVVLFSENFYAANDFITNKTMNDLKNSFNAEISDLNNAISDLDETMNGIFKDGILSEAEKISIREQLAILEREKVDVDNNYNSVYSNSNISSSVKASLKSSYDSYIISYDSLVSIINTILNKSGIISSTEQTSYKNSLVTYRGALGTYSSKLKEAIDNVTTNSINSAKNELQNEINDVVNSIDNLETNMNEVFKDGVLSEAEKTTIRQQLQTLYKEKGDVDNQYSTLYANSSLVDSSSAKPKSELKTAYDNFVSKYNSLITVIDTILNKTTIVDGSDRTRLETALSNYRTASSNYITKATNAIDSIAKKNIEDSEEKTNKKIAEIVVTSDSITQRVESVEQTTTTLTTNINTVTNTANNSVKSVEILYYLSTSQTSLAGGYWSLTAPTWVNGKYMWSKTRTTLSNGTVKESDPTCIAGAKGDTGATGATGTGIESITTEYYLSTSKTTQTGGSWVTTQPQWSNGKYLWTRSKIIYKNPTSTAYTTPVCDSSWDAINDVENKISTTNTKVSTLEVNLNSITSKVLSTETNVDNLTGEVTMLESNISEVQQTADKINWIVASGTSSSNMSLTSNAYKVIANNIDLTGKVTFNSFNSSLQTSYNTWNTASNKVTAWSGSGTSTVIDGAYIKTGSITASHISSGSITANHISGQTLTGVTIRNSTGTFVVNPSGSITIGSSSSYRTYITNSGITFTDSSGNYYSRLYGGQFRFTDSSGNDVGNVGRTTWAGTNIYLTSLNTDYGNTLALGAAQTSGGNYIADFVVSSINQTISSVYFHRGVNISDPYLAGTIYVRSSAVSSTKPDHLGKIYYTSTNNLYLKGYNRTYLSTYGGTGMYAQYNSSAVNGSDMYLYANMYCNNFRLYDTYITSTLSSASAYTRSLKNNSSLDMVTYSPYSFTLGEIRYVEREVMTTYEEYNEGNPTGKYVCYCELPVFMAENIELSYHINIGKIGEGDYKIIEKTQYYFVLESEKDGFAFTYEVVAKQIEKSDNNAVVANIGFTEEKNEKTADIEYEM